MKAPVPVSVAGRLGPSLLLSSGSNTISYTPLQTICRQCRNSHTATEANAEPQNSLPASYKNHDRAWQAYRDIRLDIRRPVLPGRSTKSTESKEDIKSTGSTHSDIDPAEPQKAAADKSVVEALDSLSQRINATTPKSPFAAKSSPSSISALSSLTDLLNADMSPSPSRYILDSLDPNGRVTRTPPQVLEPAPMRLGPVAGRTVNVEPGRGVDLSRAFQILGFRISENQVRIEERRQRFHERPGLKRKRLKSERWRRRFKQAFKAAVDRTYQLKKMGW